MKWLRLVLVSLIALLLLVPVVVVADSSAEITITAVGYIVGVPGDFTITYISDYEVGLSWTKGMGATITMVRGAIDYEPFNREDGFLVYNGTGTSCTARINLAGDHIYFFRAWSQNAAGHWEETGSSSWTDFMSASWLFMGLIAIAGLATYFALKVKLMLFRLAAAAAWVGLGVWLILSDSANLDMSDPWTQIIGFVFFMLAIAVLLLQMGTDIRHEELVRGKQVGSPGASSTSWEEWGPKPEVKSSKEMSSRERQMVYKARIQEIGQRYTGRRRSAVRPPIRRER